LLYVVVIALSCRKCKMSGRKTANIHNKAKNYTNSYIGPQYFLLN